MAYNPSPAPRIDDVETLYRWALEELTRVSAELAETIAVDLRPINAPPVRPREGMIVSADGINWNPGAGAGAYEYKGGAWVKL